MTSRGRVLRPEAVVLDEGAMVPPGNTLAPPRHFTHVVVEDAPFYYEVARSRRKAAGRLSVGARVALLSLTGRFAEVVDERGLRLYVRRTVLAISRT